MNQPILPPEGVQRSVLRAVLVLVELAEPGRDADFRRRGVRYRPCDWLDDDSPAGRQRVSRAVAQSADDGSLVRYSRGVGARTTHVRPTASLLAMALDLTDGEVDLSKILANLRRTTWGPEVVAEYEATR
ncbi:MAG: hypothetical protein NTW96_25355 [Planctomycetia bacterium]|nr:hypothetical protein [Planctomycetia bacterium]